MSGSNGDPSVFPTDSEIERRLFADPGFKQRGVIGGANPVTVEFEIDGFPGAFHSRGSWWRVYVGIVDADPFEDRNQIVRLEAFYDDWPAAGRIPLDKAYVFIEQGVALFRKLRDLSDGAFDKTERRLG